MTLQIHPRHGHRSGVARTPVERVPGRVVWQGRRGSTLGLRAAADNTAAEKQMVSEFREKTSGQNVGEAGRNRVSRELIRPGKGNGSSFQVQQFLTWVGGQMEKAGFLVLGTLLKNQLKSHNSKWQIQIVFCQDASSLELIYRYIPSRLSLHKKNLQLLKWVVILILRILLTPT